MFSFRSKMCIHWFNIGEESMEFYLIWLGTFLTKIYHYYTNALCKSDFIHSGLKSNLNFRNKKIALYFPQWLRSTLMIFLCLNGTAQKKGLYFHYFSIITSLYIPKLLKKVEYILERANLFFKNFFCIILYHDT